MSFTKITSEDLANKGVVGLPDSPNMTVGELQAKFDEIAKDVIVPKFNNLVTELENGTGTVRNANHAATATNANSAQYATSASQAGTAQLAESAKSDESGHNIEATYATKSELTEGLATKATINSDGYVTRALYSDVAIRAQLDAEGNGIIATYAKKANVEDALDTKASKTDVETLKGYFDNNGYARRSLEANKANFDNAGNYIISTYATKTELLSKADKDSSGRVALAVHADYAGEASTSTKATSDGNNNNIVNTYATKTELTNGLATKATVNNDGYVARALYSDVAIKAYSDAAENDIIETYATKTEIDGKTEELSSDIEKTNKVLDLLWKLNKGQTYDFLTQTNTSHIDDIPSGAYYGTIDVLGGMTKKCSNMWDEVWELGAINSSNGSNTTSTTQIRSKNYIPLQSGKTYTIVSNVSGSGARFMLYKADKTFIDWYTFENGRNIVASGEIAYMRFYVNGTSYASGISIVEGTSGQYEPYFSGIRSNPISEVKSVGANLWDEEWELGRYTNGVKTSATDRIRSKYSMPCKPNTVYYYVCDTNLQIHFFDDNNNFISVYDFNSVHSFTTPNNCSYLAFTTSGSYGNVYRNDIAIIRGTSGTYSPYKEDTYTIPSSSMTELISMGYGMGINDDCYNYLEFTEDKVYFRKRIAEVDLGSLTWTYKSERSGFYANMPATSIFADLSADGICTKYEVVKNNASLSTLVDKQLAYGRAFYENRSQIFIKESGYTDATTFKSAMNGVKLYYELASEQITDVTDLVSQDNTLDTESNGTMFFNGEFTIPTPHSLTYLVKLDSVSQALAQSY